MSDRSLRETQLDVARAIVLRQLTMAPRSRAHLEQALLKRQCPPDVAVEVLDRMTEVGLIDDTAYAGMFIRSAQASRGLARRALAHELRTKGVPDEVADDALALVDAGQEEELARALIAKRLRRLHGLPREVQVRRLAGMLARKGYPGDLARRLIVEAVAASEEHRRD